MPVSVANIPPAGVKAVLGPGQECSTERTFETLVNNKVVAGVASHLR